MSDQMVRLYYKGRHPAKDGRLPGVELSYGSAIDMPKDLADRLAQEPVYAFEPGPPVDARQRKGPGLEIVWYVPEPGEELGALSGIGPRRKALLVEAGIVGLSEMKALAGDHDKIGQTAAHVGVREDQMLAWIDQASQLWEVANGNT